MTTSTPSRPTLVDELTVVKLLAADHSLSFTATATQLTDADVHEIGKRYGYPDNARLSWAVDELQRQIDAGEVAAIPAGTEQPPVGATVPTQPAKPRIAAAPTPTPTPEPEVEPEPEPVKPTPIRRAASAAKDSLSATVAAPRAGRPFDATAALLLQAKESDSARLRRLGEKVEGQLVELRDLVHDWDLQRQAREYEKAERAKAKAEVERLERELAEAKARARGVAKPPAKRASRKPKRDDDPQVIRAWAADNGVPCPAHGRVPRVVVAAWREATRERAS